MKKLVAFELRIVKCLSGRKKQEANPESSEEKEEIKFLSTKKVYVLTDVKNKVPH